MNPSQIGAVRDIALTITQPLFEQLLRELCKQVAEAGACTSQYEYNLFQAKLIGITDQQIAAALSQQTQLTKQMVEELLTYAAENTAAQQDAGRLDRKVNAYLKNTTDDVLHLLDDMHSVAPNGQLVPMKDVYKQSTEYAFRQVFTGTKDYETAIRDATRKMAKAGIRTVESKSGRTYGIEYATRRAVLERMGEMVRTISEEDHETLGCDGWEISAHSGCAPDHEDIQGEQYTDKKYSIINSRLKRSIGTLNCKHFAVPITMGVNSPQYTKEQLATLQRENAEGIMYQGEHYTLYEATQQQAEIEKSINIVQTRILADRELLAAAPKLPKGQKHEKLALQLQNDEILLGRLNDEYVSFSDAAKFPLRRERLRAAGWGRSEAGHAFYTYKNYTNPAPGDILKDKKANALPITVQSVQSVKQLPSDILSPENQSRLKNEHKRLLTRVSKEPPGTEAYAAYDLNMKKLSEGLGDAQAGRVKPPDFDTPYTLAHTHPSGESFTHTDLQLFCNRKNLKLLTALGNNGVVYIMEKANSMQKVKLLRHIDTCIKKHPDFLQSQSAYSAFQKELLEGLEQYGVTYRNG